MWTRPTSGRKKTHGANESPRKAEAGMKRLKERKAKRLTFTFANGREIDVTFPWEAHKDLSETLIRLLFLELFKKEVGKYFPDLDRGARSAVRKLEEKLR